MEALFSIPVILKILIVFIVIVIANNYRIHLGLLGFLGAIILGLWIKLPLSDIFHIIIYSIFSLNTLLLSLVIFLILLLSSIMKKKNKMKEVVENFRGFFPSPKLTLATLPIIIGMLPMPGGAIFSAPLVDSFDPQHVLDNDKKSAINYFFRHTLELWWPLYPAVIFIIDITNIQISQLILLNLPLSIVLFVTGLIILLKGYHFDHLKNLQINRKKFFLSITPILIVIFCFIIILILLNLVPSNIKKINYFHTFKQYLPILIGLIFSIAYLKYTEKNIDIKEDLKNFRKYNLVLVVIGIKVFANLIDQSHIANLIVHELNFYNINFFFIILFLPFLAGLVTGVGFAYVGISFPIVLSLIPQNLSSIQFLAYIMIADAAGYMGMMLSPMHICMIVTGEYFKSTLLKIIKQIFPILVIFFIFAFIYFKFLLLL